MIMSLQPGNTHMPPASLGEDSGNTGVRTFDVLSTRTKQAFQHPGNIYFRQLIRTYRSKYHDSGDRQVKHAIAEEIVQRVFRAGGRFLKKEQGAVWRAMNSEDSQAKADHALRSAKATQSLNDTLVHRLHIPADGGPPSVAPATATQVQPVFPLPITAASLHHDPHVPRDSASTSILRQLFVPRKLEAPPTESVIVTAPKQHNTAEKQKDKKPSPQQKES